MNFDSYVVQNTNLSRTMPLSYSSSQASQRKGLKGFTLAEVLITLTIIGVVAAMTVPTLLLNYQKQTYVTGLKKAYSTLTNAMQMLPIERGCPSGDYVCAGVFGNPEGSNNPIGTALYDINHNVDGQDFEKEAHVRGYLLSQVMKVNKLCTGNVSECVTTNYQNNGEESFNNPNESQLIMADGMLFGTHAGDILVDVNGAKGPNKLGRDVFRFNIAHMDKNGVRTGTVLPSGSMLGQKYDGSGDWKSNNSCNGTNTMYGCAGRVLEEGAMNY